MKKYMDSEIVVLNNDKYLVYPKQVPVRKGKKGEINTAIKAFVKKIGRVKKRTKTK